MIIRIASVGNYVSSGAWATVDRTLTNNQTNIHFPSQPGDPATPPDFQYTLLQSAELPCSWREVSRFLLQASAGAVDGWLNGEVVEVLGHRPNGFVVELGSLTGNGELEARGPFIFFEFSVVGAVGDTDIACDVIGTEDIVT